MAATGNEVPLLSQIKALKDWIVTQLSDKANASHTHAKDQVTGLTANTVAIGSSDGKLASSGITATELDYLDGVDSNVQAQIDALSQKVTELTNTVNTLDGTVSGINTKVTNMLNVSSQMVIRTTDNGGTVTTAGDLFDSDGTAGNYWLRLFNTIRNILLSAPNASSSETFGYVDDSFDFTAQRVQPHNSAALTAAYEAGGITKASNDPAFTAADLAACKKSAEGIPYRG